PLASHLGVLRPGGVVFMAVPDQRHTVDAARPLPPLEHVSRDHAEGAGASRMPHYVEFVRSWERLDGEAAMARARELEARDYSIHFHVWTPDTFAELLVHCQRQLGL